MAGGRKSAVNFELKEFCAREETIDLSGVLGTSAFPLFSMFDVVVTLTITQPSVLVDDRKEISYIFTRRH